ncbi:MAG: hypothetical protein IIC95_11580 [Chloroflexi bacterium]|nr:hypothetical protein [Chloroflexota bacterium]
MIVTDVIGYALSSPYGANDSLGQPLGVKSIGLIEVHTDAGLVGFGETYSGVYAPELVEPAAAFWKPSLLGKDPLDEAASADLLLSIPFVGRSGLLSSVFGGIEIALWDIRGKAAGRPAHEGGRRQAGQGARPVQGWTEGTPGRVGSSRNPLRYERGQKKELGHGECGRTANQGQPCVLRLRGSPDADGGRHRPRCYQVGAAS